MLHWTEEEFWQSTPYTLSCAYIGHCQANGLGRWAVDKNGWSQVAIEEHLKMTEDLKAQFPDQPPPPNAKIGKRSPQVLAERVLH